VNIPDEHVPYILIAVEHYAAYMKATARDERAYLEIAGIAQEKETGYSRAAAKDSEEETCLID
jgi:hypothetical protein